VNIILTKTHVSYTLTRVFLDFDALACTITEKDKKLWGVNVRSIAR